MDLDFEHEDGDLDLELYNGGGTRVAYSESYTDDEFINETVSAGTYSLKSTWPATAPSGKATRALAV